MKLGYRTNEAEVQYLIAIDIYSAHYPKSIDYAVCLNCLAKLHEPAGKKDLAEKRYQQAFALFQALFPKSENFAHCLYHMSVFYKNQGNKDLTIKLIRKALEIFEEFGNIRFTSLCNDILARILPQAQAL